MLNANSVGNRSCTTKQDVAENRADKMPSSATAIVAGGMSEHHTELLLFAAVSAVLTAIYCSIDINTPVHFAHAVLTAILSMLQGLARTVFDDPFLRPWAAAGVFALMGLGGRYMWSKGVNVFWDRYVASVTIKNTDKNYDTVLKFVADSCEGCSTSNLMVETRDASDTMSWKQRMRVSNGLEQPKEQFAMQPKNVGGGLSISLRYRGHRIYMQRHVGQVVSVGWQRKPVTMEELTLWTWGGNTAILRNLMQEALNAAATRKEDDGLSVFVLDIHSWPAGWTKTMTKPPRDKDSVVMQDDTMQRVIADAQCFCREVKWYTTMGIPHRRGYLLHGPPGNGKTSFCQVLAGELGWAMCMLTLSDTELTDSSLAQYLREAPMKSIIMLEDIDAIFVERGVGKDRPGGKGISFSGLLNAIDGVAAQEGRIVIMTTNHREKLDPALIRPGRVDVEVFVDNASKSMAKRLFLRFFPGKELLAQRFSHLVPERELSMAKLQGHLLKYKTSGDEAVSAIPELLTRHVDTRLDTMTVWEHLRRLGLQQYAPMFEYHGYTHKRQLDGLQYATVERWIKLDAGLELRYDVRSQHTMQRLFSGDTELHALYQLVDVSDIKEQFALRYPPPINDAPGAAALSAQQDRLIAILTDGGRAKVSLLQLVNHLEQHGEEPAAQAVEAAGRLITPREPRQRLQPLTTAELLRRAGLERHMPAFAGMLGGGSCVRDLHVMTPENLALLGLNTVEAARLRMLLSPSDLPTGYIAEEFSLCHYSRAQYEYKLRYPLGTAVNAARFASTVTDIDGHGRLSLGQLARCLDDGGDEETIIARAHQLCIDTLERGNIASPASSPAATANEMHRWIQEWLAAGSMSEYAQGFIEQGVLSPSAILVAPEINDGVLKSILGVTKLGHRKTLLSMIADLKAAEENEKVEAVEMQLKGEAESLQSNEGSLVNQNSFFSQSKHIAS